MERHRRALVHRRDPARRRRSRAVTCGSRHLHALRERRRRDLTHARCSSSASRTCSASTSAARCPAVRPAANSGAMSSSPRVTSTWCARGSLRARPSSEMRRLIPVRPGAALVTRVRVLQGREGRTSRRYGGDWTPVSETRVVTLPVGYGDGDTRAMSGKARSSSCKRYPVVGRICMIRSGVDRWASAYNGDEVVLWRCRRVRHLTGKCRWPARSRTDPDQHQHAVPRIYRRRVRRPAPRWTTGGMMSTRRDRSLVRRGPSARQSRRHCARPAGIAPGTCTCRGARRRRGRSTPCRSSPLRPGDALSCRRRAPGPVGRNADATGEVTLREAAGRPVSSPETARRGGGPRFSRLNLRSLRRAVQRFFPCPRLPAEASSRSPIVIRRSS